MQANKDVPRHVAIIMDGNGRWAKGKHLTRTQGHAEGVKRVEEIVKTAQAIGVRVLTLFTFSTENWQRPKSEVAILMNMLTKVLREKVKMLKKNNIRFQVVGSEENVPPTVLKTLKTAMAQTRENTGLIVNLAFNYGGRWEIVEAAKKIACAVREGRMRPEGIDETTFKQFLCTNGLPDPDLLIRTSGEKRISNFLLWQLSYTELYFTDKLWPDFTSQEFEAAIADYQKRERRYGDLRALPGEWI